MEERKDNNPEIETEAQTDLPDNAEISVEPETEGAESDENAAESAMEAEASDKTDEISAETGEEVTLAAAGTTTVSASGGSAALPKLFMLFAIIIAVGIGLVFWKKNVAGHHGSDFSKVSKQEMELLLKDFNAMQKKQLAENPEQKEQLTNNVRELLSIANQAQKDGFDERPEIKDELESIEKSLMAVSYDRKINADKGPMPPFGFISEEQVNEFWGNKTQNSGISWIWNGAESRRREAEFQQFINTKLAAARKSGQISKDQQPSDDELKQARDAFAKAQIYYQEAKNKLANLSALPEAERKEWEEWKEKTELQIKLQKAQFLTQNYFQEVVSKKLTVSDEDVKKYLEEHPELASSAEKKKKADEILKRVKEGGDFAELAKEFSEDPGSKDNGGLYEGVAKGQFAPEFEKAALALKPGEVTREPVKTNFGYHIIKLEKTGEQKGANGQVQPTYDVRHILISTMIKDPENPMAREMPAEQFVKAKLEKERQEQVLNEIKKNNPVTIADFEIPKVSEEEVKQMQEQQQQQMQKQMQQMQQQQQPPEEAPKEEKK